MTASTEAWRASRAGAHCQLFPSRPVPYPDWIGLTVVKNLGHVRIGVIGLGNGLCRVRSSRAREVRVACRAPARCKKGSNRRS